MKFHLISPSGILSRYIREYWVLEADADEPEVTERIIPTGYPELMFHYKDPFLVKIPDAEPALQPYSIISGISNSFADVSTRGAAGVIAVSFYPWGACHFFNFPLSELQNQSVHLKDVLGREAVELEEQLNIASGLRERVAIVETFLLSLFHPRPEHENRMICSATKLIGQAEGQISLPQLSSSVGTSPRNLERKFSSLLGTSPKQYIRIVRFNAVVQGLWRRNHKYLTDFAYNNGYFDQSHLIREFRSFSGYTPREFLTAYPCQHAEPVIQQAG